MNAKIYRIEAKTTFSVQPGDTYWQREVIYCGGDRDDARIAYHTSSSEDYWQGYGNRARETVCEVIDDAETDDFSADEITSVSMC